jgi:hypothetical protein
MDVIAHFKDTDRDAINVRRVAMTTEDNYFVISEEQTSYGINIHGNSIYKFGPYLTENITYPLKVKGKIVAVLNQLSPTP